MAIVKQGKHRKPPKSSGLEGQKQCPRCEGMGRMEAEGVPSLSRWSALCPDCGGTGFVLDQVSQKTPIAAGRANGVQTSAPCASCDGLGHLDADGRPTDELWQRSCPDCDGYGEIAAKSVDAMEKPAAKERYESAFPVKGIVRSSTNPRKTFDELKLAELAESIHQKGVLEPLLARPTGNGDVLELIAGERRLRAAEMAGVKTVPVRILSLTDAEALEVQVIENLQREDVPAVEEAEGFQRLIKSCGYTVDALAAKLGVSTGSIYASLKLLNLPDAAREALSDGTISVSIAQLVGRVPNPEMRTKATKAILAGRFKNDEAMTFREAKEFVERELMRELKSAPFDQADENLLPVIKPCTTCPNRTGNARDLYPDGRGDICTDTACYAEKVKAHGRITLEQAKADGHKTLTAAEAKRTFSPYHGQLTYDADYVDLDATCYEAGNKKWSTVVLPEAKDEVVFAVDPHSGASRRLIHKKRAESLVRKKFPRPSPRRDPNSGNDDWKREREKAEKERRVAEAVNRAICVEAHAAAIAEPLIDGPLNLMRALAKFILASFGHDEHNEELAKVVDTVAAGGCIGVICQALLFETPMFEPYVQLRADLVKACSSMSRRSRSGSRLNSRRATPRRGGNDQRRVRSARGSGQQGASEETATRSRASPSGPDRIVRGQPSRTEAGASDRPFELGGRGKSRREKGALQRRLRSEAIPAGLHAEPPEAAAQGAGSRTRQNLRSSIEAVSAVNGFTVVFLSPQEVCCYEAIVIFPGFDGAGRRRRRGRCRMRAQSPSVDDGTRSASRSRLLRASPADGDMRRDGIAVVDAGELPPLPRRCRRGEPFGRLSSVAGRFAHLAGWPDLDEVGF